MAPIISAPFAPTLFSLHYRCHSTGVTMTIQDSLHNLGWKPFFQQQLSLDDWERFTAARITGEDRSQYHLLCADGKQVLPKTPAMPAMTVGDWVLLDDDRFVRLLDRLSVFSRKASGTRVDTQLIAANVDTVFIVSAMNQDFNLNRLERYLALSHEASVTPVVVLTRLDCCDAPEDYQSQVSALDSSLEVILVNALDADSVSQLTPWCGQGQTVALLGSSGVGKSTIVNSLLGSEVQQTHAVREDDDRGRHTTTGRSLHFLANGGLLIDTPGMRELQLADCAHGLEETFPEIIELSRHCRFSDCQHVSEPGCAVREAINAGKLEQRRLDNYQKLAREQAFNTATMVEKRQKDRQFGRYVRSVMKDKKKDRG